MSTILKSYRSGKVEVSIWENDWDGKKSYSFKFQKSYKGKDGAWKNTDFFGVSDLFNVLLLCIKLTTSDIKERQIQPKAPSPGIPPKGQEHLQGEPDLSFVADDNINF